VSRPYRKSTRNDDAQVDMTPMLDIVFIMLIFFIVTATFMDEKAIALAQPPAPSCVDCVPPQAIAVYIDAQNRAIIAGQSVEISAIADRIENLMSNGQAKAVLLRVDETADLDVVVTVKDRLDARRVPTTLKVETSPR